MATLLNVNGVKRTDRKPWTWAHVFPPAAPPEPRTATPKPAHAPAAKVDALKVFRLWKTGKPQG